MSYIFRTMSKTLQLVRQLSLSMITSLNIIAMIYALVYVHHEVVDDHYITFHHHCDVLSTQRLE